MALERTSNNSILVDTFSGEYVVFDETQAYEVGRTFYLAVAEAMVEAYPKYYLQGADRTREIKKLLYDLNKGM